VAAPDRDQILLQLIELLPDAPQRWALSCK